MKALKAIRRMRVAIAWFCLVAGIIGAITVIFRFFDYSLPMLRGDYERASQRALFGDTAIARYNLGGQAYEQNDYVTAKKQMELAMAQCMGADGQLKESHRLLAAECQFYIGNCYWNAGKKSDAAVAYQECLRLNPGHLWAKYNLEKLQESDPPPPGQTGGRSKKI